jgi:hypothetical protein
MVSKFTGNAVSRMRSFGIIGIRRQTCTGVSASGWSAVRFSHGTKANKKIQIELSGS